VSVAFNPSHLEAVDPVVEGIVRPKQDRMGDTKRERVIPILIHGDAAFAGQGVVAETLNLSQLEGYTTGGTIHLVINNQIGFTTNPDDSRSSPVFHRCRPHGAGAHFPRQRRRSGSLRALRNWPTTSARQFKKDVVIDMFCYRRHGHNEATIPAIRSPSVPQDQRASFGGGAICRTPGARRVSG
jgi:2-oxoglutarate dehydrogenase complex dehydrogenase (E1) component-like enzyme